MASAILTKILYFVCNTWSQTLVGFDIQFNYCPKWNSNHPIYKYSYIGRIPKSDFEDSRGLSEKKKCFDISYCHHYCFILEQNIVACKTGHIVFLLIPVDQKLTVTKTYNLYMVQSYTSFYTLLQLQSKKTVNTTDAHVWIAFRSILLCIFSPLFFTKIFQLKNILKVSFTPTKY